MRNNEDIQTQYLLAFTSSASNALIAHVSAALEFEHMKVELEQGEGEGDERLLVIKAPLSLLEAEAEQQGLLKPRSADGQVIEFSCYEAHAHKFQGHHEPGFWSEAEEASLLWALIQQVLVRGARREGEGF